MKEKSSSITKLLRLLALNDFLKNRRLKNSGNFLYDNRLKQSETMESEQEKDRAVTRRVLVS